ncbi:MAG: hypothetical protein HY651_08755 [Acidobacteria bacterium]|nr:hypothetical protein [Acidobacteriota bacterium]
MNGVAPPGPLRYIFSAGVAKRSLAIAAVVGCLLSITNQADVLMQEGLTPRIGFKILMNFFIPYAVSSVSALLNRNSP